MGEFNNLDKEIAELKQFIGDLKEERQAQKEKEKREAWTKYTSLTIVFIAVLAAVASQFAGKFSGQTLVNLNNATFHQAKASDQWSFYQAKSIKQNLCEVEKDQLTGLEETVGKPGESISGVAKKIDGLAGKLAKYEKEKNDIKAEAEKLEKERDTARAAAALASKNGGRMGSIISLYQISIALGSVSLLTKKQPLWYVSLLLAAIATVLFAPIFFL